MADEVKHLFHLSRQVDGMEYPFQSAFAKIKKYSALSSKT
jgi:hypothetical protein